MWKDQKILVVDVETTGLKSSTCRVIEIGACLIQDRKLAGTWSYVLDAEVLTLEPIITEITGLTIGDLKGKPKFAEMAPKIHRVMGQADHIAAYNAPFDKGFIEMEFKRAAMSLDKPELVLPERDWLDPLVWAKNYDGKTEKGENKLTEVCKRHHIKVDNAHRAGSDAQMAAEVILHYLDRVPDDIGSMIALQDVWARRQKSAAISKYRKRRK